MSDSTQKPPQDLAGGMYDHKGRWVPKRLIKPSEQMRHELVLDLVARAQAKVDADAEFERKMHDDIAAFVSISAEEYGAKLGGRKGNVLLTSFDGKYRVMRAIQEFIVFDERLLAAKTLVDECIREWVPGASSEIRTLVEHAFQVDKAGHVSTERVLSLRQLAIEHPKWADAMRAISDSMKVIASKSYVRVYELDENGKYQPLRPRGAR